MLPMSSGSDWNWSLCIGEEVAAVMHQMVHSRDNASDAPRSTKANRGSKGSVFDPQLIHRGEACDVDSILEVGKECLLALHVLLTVVKCESTHAPASMAAAVLASSRDSKRTGGAVTCEQHADMRVREVTRRIMMSEYPLHGSEHRHVRVNGALLWYVEGEGLRHGAKSTNGSAINHS